MFLVNIIATNACLTKFLDRKIKLHTVQLNALCARNTEYIATSGNEVWFCSNALLERNIVQYDQQFETNKKKS